MTAGYLELIDAPPQFGFIDICVLNVHSVLFPELEVIKNLRGIHWIHENLIFYSAGQSLGLGVCNNPKHQHLSMQD